MANLLFVSSSLFGDGSQSRTMATEFIDRWRQANPRTTVVERELTADSMPHLSLATLTAAMTPADKRSAAERQAAALADTLIEEVEAADVIVIAAPMYNFSIPSTMKAWIDHITRAGRTFRYGAAGAEGLLKGKKVFIVTARGGIYSEGPAKSMDFQAPYLRAMLGVHRPRRRHLHPCRGPEGQPGSSRERYRACPRGHRRPSAGCRRGVIPSNRFFIIETSRRRHGRICIDHSAVRRARLPGVPGVTAHGPITRLMSPSDFGQLLKPFVFLDLFDNNGIPFNGFGLHPHSGIATLTYIAEGSVSYEDTNGATGLLPAGGVEWMQAGGGVWHGGGAGEPGRTRGFQLWIALPPSLELGPSQSLYLAPDTIQQEWSCARAARKLWIREERHRSALAHQLSRSATEEGRTLALPAAGRTYRPLDRGRRGRCNGARRASPRRPGGLRTLERPNRTRSSIRRGVGRRFSRAARS